MNRFSPIHLALLCILSWSFLPVVARLGQSQLDSFQFLFWTNLLSALAVGLTLNWRLVFRAWPFSKGLYLSTAGLGFLGCFFYYLCLYYGYAQTQATEVLIIQYLWPALTALLAVPLLGERLSSHKVGGIALGLIAAIIVITRGQMNQIQAEAPIVLAIVFSGAFAFSLFSVLSKKEPRALPNFNVFMYFAWAALFSAIAMNIWSDFQWPTSSEILPLGINGALINGLSYVLWINALSRAEASKIAPLVYLAPVLSIIWITLWFGEPFLMPYAVAITLAIISGLLVSRSSSTATPEPL